MKDLPGLENQKELPGIENQKELPGVENQIRQYEPDVNRGHGNIDNQPKTNRGLDLQTDLEINNQHNTIPTPLLTPSSTQFQMLPSSMHIPPNFPNHNNRDRMGGELNTDIGTILNNVRGGFNNLPIDNSIQNVEGLKTTFDMEGHNDTYGDVPMGQLGTPQRWLSQYRQETGNPMELHIMSHTSPGMITYLGARPKTYAQGRMNSVPGYNELNQNPIEDQKQIWANCVNNTTRAGVLGDQTSNAGVVVEQHGGVYRGSIHTAPVMAMEQHRGVDIGPTHTAPVLAMEQHGGEYRNSNHTAPVLLGEQHGRVYREVNQTRPVHGAYKSKEQSDYIQQLSADQGSCNTVKQGVMKSISEKLQGMKLHEIRKFQENLPQNLSQVR